MQRETRTASVGAAEFFEDDEAEPAVHACTTILFGHGWAEKALFACLQPSFSANVLVSLPCRVMGGDLSFDKLAKRIAEHIVFRFKECTVQHWIPPVHLAGRETLRVLLLKSKRILQYRKNEYSWGSLQASASGGNFRTAARQARTARLGSQRDSWATPIFRGGKTSRSSSAKLFRNLRVLP